MINIALIYGGNASEKEISKQSGAFVAQHIDRSRYRVFEVLLEDTVWMVERCDGAPVNRPIHKDNFTLDWEGQSLRFDLALIMIHGTPGENGLLQAYLDLVHVPYTTCSAAVSTVTFDKYYCKSVLRGSGIPMAREIRLRKPIFYADGHAADLPQRVGDGLGWPVFVKPNAEGSSFGVTKVHGPEALLPAIENAFRYDEVVLIEEFLPGRELTNGCFQALQPDGSVKTYVLPVTEIVPDADCEFFDYEAKYLGKSQEITPAPVSPELTRKVQDYARRIYEWLGCTGMVRMDFIAHNEEPYFLEVNSVPGMTRMSLIPQQLREAGYSIEDYLTALIEDALLRGPQ